jgi:hypothetical protein
VALCIGPALRRHFWILPLFSRASKPAFVSTRRCLETAGSETAKGAANSVTRASPRANRSKMARRVESANAPKVASREVVECLTTRLNIKHAKKKASGI